MRYGSVCSGIEAATAAWHHMAWEPAFFSEIEKFPRAVLEHHYPEVPLHGDFTTIEKNQYGQIDLLVGGTPCQSFSVAGLRGGLDDDRGNLALEFCRLAQREQPRWIVWENVPGVLSSGGGRDFGSILGALEDLGYGLAYRVLDAQYFGVAQRRRRVFVVGYLGDWRPAAAVLFERHSMSGPPAPRREARQETAGVAAAGTGGGGGAGRERPAVIEVAPTLNAGGNRTGGDRPYGTSVDTCDSLVVTAPEVANAITASLANGALGHNKGENVIAFDAYNQTETSGVSKTVAARNDQDTASCVAFEWQRGATQNLEFTENFSPALIKSQTPAVAFAQNTRDEVRLFGGDGQIVGALAAQPGMKQTTYIAFDTTQITSAANYSSPQPGDPCHPLAAGAHPPAVAIQNHQATHDVAGTMLSYAKSGGDSNRIDNAAAGYRAVVAFQSSQSGVRVGETHATLDANNGPRSHNGALVGSAVRRLTPIECERLQGFPDNFTAIPWGKKGAEDCPDGPRYKALGNSMAVPVMRWIGERIALIDATLELL